MFNNYKTEKEYGIIMQKVFNKNSFHVFFLEAINARCIFIKGRKTTIRLNNKELLLFNRNDGVLRI